jgi:integrase/recombinase XerC
MDSINSLHPLAKTWLLDGPLAAHVEAYTANLEQGSYSRQTSCSHVDALAHFAHWMARCTLTVGQLDDDCVNQFLSFHLPNCDCHSIALRSHDQLRAGLGLLLEVLRDQRVIAELLPPTGPIAEELDRYDAHMRDARGLAVGTRKNRLHMVGQFLRWKFADREFIGQDILVEDLRAFITKELERVNTTSHAKTFAASFRAYFRYRLTCGDEVRGLLGAISTPAQWTLASLPRALTAAEVQRLMAHCEQTVSSRWRLLSMVRLALDLGLRSGEIAKLELSDIDWRNGTVKLKQTKSMRQDILPLPTATGEALAEYLRHERPNTTLKTIFVRLKAPHDQPVGVDAVRSVIGRALRFSGIAHGRSHSLRHTLACRIVNGGGSIKDVADVLRHRSLDTSVIYAKLDQHSLLEVALPWPGSTV